jgi:hypothetical protein
MFFYLLHGENDDGWMLCKRWTDETRALTWFLSHQPMMLTHPLRLDFIIYAVVEQIIRQTF